jgi:hypothetical protein
VIRSLEGLFKKDRTLEGTSLNNRSLILYNKACRCSERLFVRDSTNIIAVIAILKDFVYALVL